MEFMSVAIDKIVYLSLLGLGMYFFYEGDVVSRYRLRKTNFAEKSEQVKELPTILAHIEFKYPFSISTNYYRDYSYRIIYSDYIFKYRK